MRAYRDLCFNSVLPVDSTTKIMTTMTATVQPLRRWLFKDDVFVDRVIEVYYLGTLMTRFGLLEQ